MGLSKPWGVWEGGFDERLGKAAGGLSGILKVRRAGNAPELGVKNPFGYELQRPRDVSNGRNLTNEIDPC